MAPELQDSPGHTGVERLVVAASVAACWIGFVVVPILRSIPLEHQGGLGVDEFLPGLAWTTIVGLAAWYVGRLPGRRTWPWLAGLAGVVLLTGSFALLPFEFAAGEAEGSTWTAFFPTVGVALVALVAAVVGTVLRRVRADR